MKKSGSLILTLFFVQFFVPISAQTGQKPELVVQLGHTGEISSAVYSPDGRFIVSGGISDRTAILWEASTGREIRRFIGHQAPITSVAFSPDSRFILTGSGDEDYVSDEIKDNTARLWDISNGAEILKFNGHTSRVNSVCFSPNGKMIVTASDDKSARVWDAKTAKNLMKYDHKSSVPFADFSPDGRAIVTAAGSEAWFFDLINGSVKKAAEEPQSGENEGEYNHNQIKSARFSPDGRFLITASEQNINAYPNDYDLEKKVRQWNIQSGQVVGIFAGTSPGIVSSDGQLTVTGGAGENMAGASLWNTETKQKIHHMNGHKSTYVEGIQDGNVVDAAFSPNGHSFLLVFGINAIANAVQDAGENSIYVYDTSTKEKRFSLGRLAKKVSSINFSVRERLLVGNSVWNSETGAQQQFEEIEIRSSVETTETGVVQKLSNDGNLALGFTTGAKNNSEDGRSLDSLMASNGKIVTVWDADSGRILRRFGRGYAAHFSPDSRFLLTESFKETQGKVDTVDNGGITLTLWNIKTGEKIWHRAFDVRLVGVLIRSLNFAARSLGQFSEDAKFVIFHHPDRDKEVINVLDSITGKIVFSAKNSEAEPITTLGKFFLQETGGGQNTGDENSAAKEKLLSVWEIKSQKLVSQVKLTQTEKFRLASTDNSLLATSELSHERKQLIRIWNSMNGKLVNQFYVPTTEREFFEDEISFSPDNRFLIALVGSDVYFYEIKTGIQNRKISVPRFASVTEGVFSPDYRFVLIDSDGTRIYDFTTGEEICRLMSFDDGTWVVATRDGRFDTNNLESIVGLHWILPDDPLRPKPVEIFSRQYFEPELLSRLLKCNENGNCEQEFKPLPSIAEINRLQPKVALREIKSSTTAATDLVDVTVEVVNVLDDLNGSLKTVGKANRVSSGAFDLRLFRDGQLVGSATPKDRLETFIDNAPRLVEVGKAQKSLLNTPEDIAWRAANDLSKVVKFGADGKAVYTFRNVRTPRGGQKEVEFSAYAFNSDRVKSDTARAKFKIGAPKTRQGKTYLVSIGVNASENSSRVLYQSAKVAQKTQEILAPRLVGGAANVIGISLVSRHTSETSGVLAENNATKAKIKAVFSLLGGSGTDADRKILAGIANVEKIETVQPEDELIIVFSGHGDRDRNGFFYLLPYDIGANPNEPGATRKMISSDELSLWMRDITAKEMIFVIDACRAGASVQSEGFKPGPMGSRGLGQLAYDKGMKILAATQSSSAAWQACTLGQSVLSYALFQEGVIEGKADTIAPKGKLTANEWLTYAEARVPTLHQEVNSGKFGVACSQSQGNAAQSRLQTPKLFDFTRNRPEGFLITLR